MKVTSLSGFKKTWLTTGLPPLALLAGQHASPCFVNHKTSDNSALIIPTPFYRLANLDSAAQSGERSGRPAGQDNIETVLGIRIEPFGHEDSCGYPSRAGGHERWLRPVVRSHSGLSHGREGIGWVAGCEMPDDGGRRGQGWCGAHCGLMWDKLGSRVAHPDPIR